MLKIAVGIGVKNYPK